MPQQVFAHLTASGEAWAARDLARILQMPLSTVRAQLRRLEATGRVRRLEGRYAGKTLWQVPAGPPAVPVAPGRPDGPQPGGPA
jgi:predicted ArsR family transcriptional regulator